MAYYFMHQSEITEANQLLHDISVALANDYHISSNDALRLLALQQNISMLMTAVTIRTTKEG